MEPNHGPSAALVRYRSRVTYSRPFLRGPPNSSTAQRPPVVPTRLIGLNMFSSAAIGCLSPTRPEPCCVFHRKAYVTLDQFQVLLYYLYSVSAVAKGLSTHQDVKAGTDARIINQSQSSLNWTGPSSNTSRQSLPAYQARDRTGPSTIVADNRCAPGVSPDGSPLSAKLLL